MGIFKPGHFTAKESEEYIHQHQDRGPASSWQCGAGRAGEAVGLVSESECGRVSEFDLRI